MTRQGPRLTVVATCDGCEHLTRTWSYDECRHPNGKANHAFSDTPAWCPLLPTARLALGRELVAESSKPNGAGEEGER
jgi:hypothetical protein